VTRVMVLHEPGKTARQLARIYHEMGYDVTIGYSRPPKQVMPLNPEIKEVILGAKSTLELVKRTLPYAKKMDFVHCNFCHSPLFAGYFSKLFYGKNYIAHARGDDIRKNPNEWYGFLTKHAMKRAKLLLVSTPDLINFGKKIREDVVWVPNPVDPEIFKPCNSRIDLHLDSDYVIFMPSQINFSSKRTDMVVKQFSFLPSNFSLHLACGFLHGESRDVQALRELIGKLGIESRVFIHGYMPHEDLVQFYNEADLIIDQFGGLHAFGNVTIEALACEKTVITDYNGSDYPEKPPIESIEVNQLANSVLELVKRSEFHNPSGRRWVLKYHSFEQAEETMRRELKRVGL